MKKIKKLVATAAILAFTISAVGCNMIEKTPEAIAKTIVAKVGDKKVTRKDLDSHPEISNALAQMKEQYGENFQQSADIKEKLKEMKLQVLNILTLEKAIVSEAEKLKVIPTEEQLKKDIDGEIVSFKKMRGIKDDKQLEQMLKSSGLTVGSFRNIMKNKIIFEKLQNLVTKDIKVDEKEVKDYYEKNKDRYPKDPKKVTKVHLAHILIQGRTPEEQQKAKVQIENIKKKLDKGELFEKLAKEYSQDGSRDKGGDLGTKSVINSGFVEEFINGAIPLKDGEVSEPVRTQFGYHLIKMIKKYQEPVKSFDEVKNEIKETLLNKKKNELWTNKITEIKKNAKIKIYEEKLV